eukprot:TRINITY_DN102274_c0_g1_i1.p1 TRINITY_DN102274_c0_g1~~TRINITY_DN102274_c0_g1_i1.p1  ORF type:complete len:668 (+),score=61.99 TRINITY_DN102274_c0_g1_i1:39-2042(+)
MRAVLVVVFAACNIVSVAFNDFVDRPRAASTGRVRQDIRDAESRDCYFGPWGRWSSCHSLAAGEASCQRGQQLRRRSIEQPALGMLGCSGALVETVGCGETACDRDLGPALSCIFSDWSEWSRCAQNKYEASQQVRSRQYRPAPANGPRAVPCEGALMQTKICVVNRGVVTADCRLSEWSEFRPCSASCGIGNRMRSRHVVSEGAQDGKSCEADTIQAYPCHQLQCPPSLTGVASSPVDCVFDEWSSWSACSPSGEPNHRIRSRNIRQHPVSGGHPCLGSLQQVTGCHELSESRDCEVSDWGLWSMCSQTCGGGRKRRSRSVVRLQAGRGRSCPMTYENDVCNSFQCPTGNNGCRLSPWSAWGACSATCGHSAQRLRTRKITSQHECVWNPQWDIPLVDVNVCANLPSCMRNRYHEHFCPQHGGFTVGQPVAYGSRGGFVVACLARHSQGSVVGVCRSAEAAQDDGPHNYPGYEETAAECDEDQAMQMRLCRDPGLVFVNCDDLSLQMSRVEPAYNPFTKFEGNEARHFLSDLLIDHADALQNMTHLLDDSLAWMFSGHKPTDPKLHGQHPLPPATPRPEKDEENDERVDEGDVENEQETVAPLIVSGVSMLGMVLCGGFACGTLCHARLLRGGAATRQVPLLASERTSSPSQADVEMPAVAVHEAE